MTSNDSRQFSSPSFIVILNVFGAILLSVVIPFGPFIGVPLGIVCLPWTYEIMRYRPIWIIWSVVYLPAFVIGWFTFSVVGDSAALSSVLASCTIVSILADRVLPEYRPPPTACPKCGYDLRGLDHARCPECGAESQRLQPPLGV